MSDTSSFLKGKIIALHEHTSKSGREIARDLELSHATVARVIKKYEETGSVESEREGRCGAKRKTSEREDRHLLRMSKQNPRLSSTDLANELHQSRGINVDPSTVRRRLLEADRPALRPIKCQVLTDRMKASRLEWAKSHQSWTLEMWEKVSCFFG